MGWLGPPELAIRLPDLVRSRERVIIGAMPFGDEQLAAAPDHQVPALIALGQNACGRAPTGIVQPPHGYRQRHVRPLAICRQI